MSFNGNGEMTGLPGWTRPACSTRRSRITNTHDVGVVRDALSHAAMSSGHRRHACMLPIAAETYDGWLNDINALHVTQRHVLAALAAPRRARWPEGNVGGGTGHDLPRVQGRHRHRLTRVATGRRHFTVGALVQANYGSRATCASMACPSAARSGSIACPCRIGGAGRRPARSSWCWPPTRRCCRSNAAAGAAAPPLGLARVGGVGHNGSGDIFLAFATGNRPAEDSAAVLTVPQMLPTSRSTRCSRRRSRRSRKSILNALATAETMTGLQGRTVHALPYDLLAEAMGRYRRRD